MHQFAAKHIRRLYFIALSLVAILTGGCSAVNVEHYAAVQPEFDMLTYFSGATRGWGIVYDRRGKVNRQFVVDIEGAMDGTGQFTLDESFVWSDGEKSRRLWKIRRLDQHTLRGSAEDVVGTAHGSSYGNALNWRYKLKVDVEGRVWKINFDDWMFLQPNDVLINRAVMRKFGIRVGEVFIVFNKLPAIKKEKT